jgi:UDP:flavonoid glycosyltransferase YjiC (YdhE family)
MTAASAVVFSMGDTGHFKRLRPLIAGLAARGMRTHVFSAAALREESVRLGARFHDLFAGRPIAAADAASVPLPSRSVSFAGHFGDDVVREVAVLAPSVVIHDAFAVIGRVVAHHLRVPRVNVCAGHNLAPGPTLAALAHDPRVRTSEACLRAIDVLRCRHGMPDAGPFSYIDSVSHDLNVYCEPPQFLLPDERSAFEPIAFFGSLLPDPVAPRASAPAPFGGDGDARLRLYVSFGTVIWSYYEPAAAAALMAIADEVATIDDAAALVSLGGRDLPGLAARLARRNVRVSNYVDQWDVLRDATAMITHQGLNSTHEAIWHGVPMISYPFFTDQPGLARRCASLGLAVPLVAPLRGAVQGQDVRAALARIAADVAVLRERLATARAWEEAVIRERPAVIERILRLAG